MTKQIALPRIEWPPVQQQDASFLVEQRDFRVDPNNWPVAYEEPLWVSLLPWRAIAALLLMGAGTWMMGDDVRSMMWDAALNLMAFLPVLFAAG